MKKSFFDAKQEKMSPKRQKRFNMLCSIEGAKLALTEKVSEYSHKAIPHKKDTNYFRQLSRKTGWSVKRLKDFFESSSGIEEAAEILHKIGYKVTDICVEKI